MRKRTTAQNSQLFGLFNKYGVDTDMRAVIAHNASNGRTTHTSELSYDECQAVIDGFLAEEKKLNRLKWRLYFVFAESKYEAYRVDNNTKKPNIQNIHTYCQKHWNKTPETMSARELENYIAIISKWK